MENKNDPPLKVTKQEALEIVGKLIVWGFAIYGFIKLMQAIF